MKQVQIPFENDTDPLIVVPVMSEQQRQQLIELMAQAISTVLQPHLGDDDDPS